MKRVHYLLLFGWLTLALLPSSDAQNFYYGPDGRTYLEVSTEKVLVQFQPWVSPARQQAVFDEIKGLAPLNPELRLPAPRVVLAPLDGIGSEAAVYDLLRRLRDYPEIAYANHFLMHKDGTAHGITDRLLVRLYPGYDESLLQSMARAFGANVEKQNGFDDQLYHLTVANTQTNALQLANQLHETGLFDYAEPDFLRIMKRMNTNDPFVDNQWALNNDGANTSSWGGVAGADMKVFSAWASTTGATTIKVAILDEGVDLNHPDLIDNLLPGYDATGQGSAGGPSGDDAHGTACAGIVAAAGNNSTGVAGVAYTSKIIPVRIAYSNATGGWVTSNAVIADAINWAWQTGEADVLSNSWGGGSSSSAINGAIDGAVNNGRGGLGAPVLFAAGNDNGANSYPATYEPTISVIAMSMCNQRKSPSSCDGETWWGSNYGTGADIAAPGVKIYATDISGSAGYSNGDYVSNFNGTSSACPNAAGVMALILSANPGLTEDQARFALESTTDKVGGYAYSTVSGQPNGSWSQELGYGRVNAQAAVNSVAPSVNDDAAISAIITPKGTICASSAIPELTLYNAGANDLTSATVNYQVDGGTVETYNWTGSLPSLGSTNIVLPSISFSSGSHTFTAYTSSPNGVGDNNPANDDAGSSFSSGTNGVTLTILLDNYPGETTWDIRDSGGAILASGGPYGTAGATVVENTCLPDGCFDFTIYDSYGDGICCGFGSGSYELVSDANGAVLASGGAFTSQETTNFCLSGAPDPLAVTVSSTDVSCAGGSDGSATANTTGGVSPYNYLWNTGATTATISGLPAGTYSVTVTDQNNDQATASAAIGEPAALTVAPTANDITCGGTDDGTVAANASGGTGTITYNWTDAGGTTVGTTATLSNLAAGDYFLTASDANGCTASGSVTVSDPNATWYADADGDTYGDPISSVRDCTAPTGYVADNTDCDDTDGAVNPGATELCDGIDNNCDGQIDEGFTQNTYYADADGDGYGDPNGSITACTQPSGYVTDNTDCDDTDGAVNPGATEVCDGIDNNCDGQIDEGFTQNTYYADADGDTFGDPNNSTNACSQPAGYVTNSDDCDDTDGAVYPGGTCNDGNACTINDVYDTNCNCVGTFADADGDGVCDADDACPGFDDSLDADGDGIPDGCDNNNCVGTTTNFTPDPLTHQGTGSSVSTLNFGGIHQDVSFDIIDINQKDNGSPSTRYIDVVTVEYDQAGATNNPQFFGTYTPNDGSTVSITLPGDVTAVYVSLSDGLDGNAGTQMSVDLSPVSSCDTGGSCADDDGDGVCNSADVCPGFDDNVDSDGDGIPDGCDTGCATATNNFPVNPLDHTGGGSSSTTLDFGAVHTDVSFTISNLDAKANGNASRQYVEQVTVTYDDGTGATLTVGVFDGNSVNSVPVDIAGNVASVTVTLEDVLDDGVTQSVLSVDFTQVTSCAPAGPGSVWQPFSGESENELDVPMDLRLFPNPARDELTVRYGLEVPAAVRLQITDLNGRTRHLQQQSLEAGRQEARLAVDDLPAGVYLLHLWKGSEQETRRFVIVR